MSDDTRTWELIHAERRSLADTIDSLSAGQWTTPSLCTGWTVHLAAAHILAEAEQTPLGL
jgi:hypothetical protein